MRVAVVGSRSITNIDISVYMPYGMAELVSGGAIGIDTLAEAYADENRMPKLILRPQYEKYGKSAPLVRDREIVDVADVVVAVWDGKYRGTKYTIDYAKKQGIEVLVYIINEV